MCLVFDNGMLFMLYKLYQIKSADYKQNNSFLTKEEEVAIMIRKMVKKRLLHLIWLILLATVVGVILDWVMHFSHEWRMLFFWGSLIIFFGMTLDRSNIREVNGDYGPPWWDCLFCSASIRDIPPVF